jgi:hypothetical protein
MTEHVNSSLTVDVDPDNYADPAVEDAPPVPRTFQTESEFQAQRSTYSAKIDHSADKIYQALVAAIPALKDPASTAAPDAIASINSHSQAKIQLGKKDTQLLEYTVGALYFDQKYQDIIKLCDRVEQCCELNDRLAKALARWRDRCRARCSSEATDTEGLE